MPNHIHGILILNNKDLKREERIIAKNRFQNIGKGSISSIIGSYKSAVTKHAHRLGFQFQWQKNYYEHIIRNTEEYTKIAKYIINNPLTWEKDTYF